MPGDGIGQAVLPEAIRVLERIGFDAEYVHADIGWEFWTNEGNALPERTVEMLGRKDWVMFIVSCCFFLLLLLSRHRAIHFDQRYSVVVRLS